MSRSGIERTFMVLGLFLGLAIPQVSMGADSTDDKTLREIRRELKALAQTRAKDRDEIQRLAKRVEQLEIENHRLKASVAESDTQIKKETAQTTQAIKQFQAQSETGPSVSQFSEIFHQYLGSHTFQVTGAAGGSFVYDQQSGALDSLHHATQNSFFLDWEPMVLYRPADWILFQAELEAGFGQAGVTSGLPVADFQIFLNDYLTVVAGLFDQPFGDWYESQSPMWVNRFITAPLPFGVEPVVPPSELGVAFRGGLQWGHLGQDFDYTLWTGNGPGFSEPVPGAIVGSPTAIAFKQTNGKSFGGRLRFFPIPIDMNLGRLELGVSTYNGKWLDDNWFNAWGLSFLYFNGNLQTRGEWMQSYRQVPGRVDSDNRQGWYLQLGYFLSGIKLGFLPDQLNDYLRKLEPLIRYSGVNQHFVAIDDITTATGIGVGGLQLGRIPDFGVNGSPALFAPHSREVALGLDYWVAPSIVWQNEFDLELPRADGVFVRRNGTTVPAGSVPNDYAVLSRFTIGF